MMHGRKSIKLCTYNACLFRLETFLSNFNANFNTKQAMYVQRNTEARSCYHCCSGKAISIAYSDRVFVALGIQHAMQVRRIISSSGCNLFFHIIS
jgi:hypothetical protein